MTYQKKNNIKKPLGISLVIGLIVFAVSYDFGMFWDNVLFASKLGNQLFYHDLFNWMIPDNFDPGHPPFLGFLLASVWKIMGHSSWVSHLTMLPFIVGTVYQLYHFVNFYTNDDRLTILGLILILADPTLLTSFVLVNPEIIIIFFFFLTVSGILYKHKIWKFTGLFFLSIISFRSMMLFAGVFLFEIFNHSIVEKKKIKKLLNFQFFRFYFTTALPGIIFVIWRIVTKGWLQTHPESPWASMWKLADFKQFLINSLVLIWRYLDFGRVFIFIFLLISLWVFRQKISKNKSIQQLIFLGFSSVMFIVITILFSTNAFGHRYFIVSYICFTLVAFLMILELKKNKKTIYLLLFTGLITGNLWIYPEKISQGWDATLAHVPYHTLRRDAIAFLEAKKIDFKQVGTFFPNVNTIDEIDLSGDHRSFTHFNKNNSYVFFSNVYNVSDKKYTSLLHHFIEIKRFEKYNIYVSIHKKIEK